MASREEDSKEVIQGNEAKEWQEVLIKCQGNVLVPISSIGWCEDLGDAIVIHVGDLKFMARDGDIAAIRSLVVGNHKGQANENEQQVRPVQQIPRFPIGKR